MPVKIDSNQDVVEKLLNKLLLDKPLKLVVIATYAENINASAVGYMNNFEIVGVLEKIKKDLLP